jgi:hypothetical protein
MNKPKADKRLTPIRHLVRWLKSVAGQCATNKTAEEMADPIALMASELSISYPESAFTEQSATDIAMSFQFGWPTIVQMRKAIDTWRKEKGDLGKAGAARLEFSEARTKDPRFSLLDLEQKIWLSTWDRRTAEIKAAPDPLWDSADGKQKRQSKLANLASMFRTYAPPIVWQMIATPFQATREIDAAAFLSEWLRLAPLEPMAPSDDPLRRPREEDALSF